MSFLDELRGLLENSSDELKKEKDALDKAKIDLARKNEEDRRAKVSKTVETIKYQIRSAATNGKKALERTVVLIEFGGGTLNQSNCDRTFNQLATASNPLDTYRKMSQGEHFRGLDPDVWAGLEELRLQCVATKGEKSIGFEDPSTYYYIFLRIAW